MPRLGMGHDCGRDRPSARGYHRALRGFQMFVGVWECFNPSRRSIVLWVAGFGLVLLPSYVVPSDPLGKSWVAPELDGGAQSGVRVGIRLLRIPWLECEPSRWFLSRVRVPVAHVALEARITKRGP